ncbi:MAG: O-methyltransferase [Firmicutes bacterium]|jgi:O-methyltransferase family protein|nr:O-methyltransferase [Bacillota bacterium]MDY5336072.1 O-methyltransferase [Bacilli bacterium]MEE0635396.1 O-methyltransferase [Bacilli bacterium]OLA35314.1 MAG: SAM-dependent methyltransferase [Firmicutes bacterium CAG:321_26_22]
MKELEEYAKINNIPIMQKDGILYLINYIKENNIKNILEIGSAIGYSSIMMASINSDIRITTIERDKDRYDLAVSNIKKYNLDKQINIIYGDAVDTDITGMYDLIFIDAAKGKNIFFFEKYKNNLVKGGTIITDNLSFHGLVEDSDLVKTKNQRGIVNKIKDFISFLDNNEEFATEYIPVGDKIAISKRRSDYE